MNAALPMAQGVSTYVFGTHAQAEAAIGALARAGLDVKKLSLVGQGYHTEERPVGFYTLGDRVRAWGGTGAFWGGIWGLLLTPAVFFFPGVGVLAMAGPVASALVGALEGAVVVGGVSALAAALTRMGLSHADAVRFEGALKADHVVLTVHGSDADASLAAHVLSGFKGLQAA